GAACAGRRGYGAAPCQPEVRAPVQGDGGAGQRGGHLAEGSPAARARGILGTRQAAGREGPVKRFSSFSEFYPFYLQEHSNRTSRRLHFIGSCCVLLLVVLAVRELNPWWLLAALVCGYGFAWVGHFFFEKNRPATFRHPVYSFMGDWVMFKDILSGKIRF